MEKDIALTFLSIGIIRTRFNQQAGTPIQGHMVPDEVGTLVLDEQYVGGLTDLEGFSHLWLIYVFHQIQGWTPKVKPYLDTVEHGIFATRSPRRPNPIGMTRVRLLKIEGNTLTVSGVDMLDGTPLLDIKPCVPYFDEGGVDSIGWFQSKIPDKPVLADRRFE